MLYLSFTLPVFYSFGRELGYSCIIHSCICQSCIMSVMYIHFRLVFISYSVLFPVLDQSCTQMYSDLYHVVLSFQCIYIHSLCCFPLHCIIFISCSSYICLCCDITGPLRSPMIPSGYMVGLATLRVHSQCRTGV